MLLPIVVVVLFLVVSFALDDLFVDGVALVKRLGPRELTDAELERWRRMPEKSIAIMVANWQEAEIIAKMIVGNNRNVQYENFHFFLGVYPNDPDTIMAAQSAAAAFKNVHVVVNSKDGPTTKGQMLNEIARSILRRERRLGIRFDVFLMHDSEDILHPLSLKMINAEIDRAEFLQIPVFSFERKIRDWVGSTYIDEFAEIHTKEILVREAMGAPLPSAGVGTALQRKLMRALILEGDSCFLREESLTEDYVLGMSAALKGFRTAFASYYRRTPEGRDFIATREYFPNSFKAAVRQKTRWVLGIVFQGSKVVPWTGSWMHKYFLYRDRRGPMNNLVALATTLLTGYLLLLTAVPGHAPEFVGETWFIAGSGIATVGAFSRLLHRMYAVYLVNGARRVWLVPLRWPLGNLINFSASLRAARDYRRAIVKKEPLRWAKTTHELPEEFGHDIDSLGVPRPARLPDGVRALKPRDAATGDSASGPGAG